MAWPFGRRHEKQCGKSPSVGQPLCAALHPVQRHWNEVELFGRAAAALA